jgi:branched-chain amino acid transport system ATP-binding protein
MALKTATLTVNPGEIVGVLGRNGAGKTTLLNTISGLIKARAGQIFFGEKDITGLPPHEIARQGIAHVPEGRRIFPELTVRENLEVGAYGSWGRRLERLEGVLEVFPALRSRLKQPGGTLSGGEQQMLAIGRGLMGGPQCLLLDEPSLGLAPLIIDGLFAAIEAINRRGVAILLVEQNAVLTLERAKRVYVMQNGMLASEGRAADLRDTDVIRAAYLGLRAPTAEK